MGDLGTPKAGLEDTAWLVAAVLKLFDVVDEGGDRAAAVEGAAVAFAQFGGLHLVQTMWYSSKTRRALALSSDGWPMGLPLAALEFAQLLIHPGLEHSWLTKAEMLQDDHSV